MSGSRSPSCSPPVDVDSEIDLPLTSPSPPPQAVSEECYRSTNAIFVKRWARGFNSCSRCDFEFVPLAGSRLAYKRADRAARPTGSSQHHGGSGKLLSKSTEDRKLEIKKEEKMSPVPKKRPPPPDGPYGDAQITSSLMGPGPFGLGGNGSATPGVIGGPMMPPFMPPDSQAWRAYMMMHDPTPALRQLSEYARPHLGSGKQQDLVRPAGPLPTGPQPMLPPGVDPFGRPGLGSDASAAVRAQQARGRFEEIDSKHPRLESKELSMMRDDVKPIGRDWPTPPSPNTSRPLPSGMPSLPPGVPNPFELQLAELQRLYATSLTPQFGTPGAPPLGWFPAPNLAAELLQRERLEQLAASAAGFPNSLDPALAAAIAASRLPGADRLNLPSDPLFRLQMASAGLAGPPPGSSSAVDPLGSAEMSHTHTHSHTHLHLHQPDPTTAAATSIFPPFHPLFASQLAASGLVDPLAAAAANSAAALQGMTAPGAAAALQGALPFMPGVNPAAAAAYNIAANQQLAREQELMYRELLSRAPYNNDPILTQQLLAQAAASQEMQRRLEQELKLQGGLFPR